ncbi:O-antigen ligase family protein [Flagellimonas iocasae]|uniref:O-antigen ligase family protein n=1 Tax=Flagellimonas iocasae TaxID=2055905 RepID=A0ABW4XUR0_9FLAO
MNRTLKYLALGFTILNFPTIGLSVFGGAVGSIVSSLSFLLMIAYAAVSKSMKPSRWFLLIWASYYVIAGLQFNLNVGASDYISRMFKFLIVAIFAGEILNNTNKKEMFWFLFIGASSVIINAVFFPDNYGRYGGFYIDPNAAGFICISGYALTYAIPNARIRILGQFIFSLAGFLTFSRTFILIWLLVNLISLKISLKNARVFILGALVIIIMISFSKELQLNAMRFKQLENIVLNEKVDTNELNEDSRTKTWAIFYDYILDKPIFGNGYGSFQGNGVYRIGPHNTFLFIIGEAGIIAIAIFLAFQFVLLKKSLEHFKKNPQFIMLFIAQFLFLLTNHNYFTAYYLLFVTLWFYINIKKLENEN